jgi:hypothetical protein
MTRARSVMLLALLIGGVGGVGGVACGGASNAAGKGAVPPGAAPAEIAPYDAKKPWPHVGEAPPELAADAWLREGPNTLADFAGRVVVVHFCDLGSEPCVQDFARLRVLHDKHAAKGLVIITLAFAEFDDEARASVSKLGIAWQVGFGDRVLEIGETYNYDQYPAAYVIGRDGKLRWSGLSVANADALAAAIEAALAG